MGAASQVVTVVVSFNTSTSFSNPPPRKATTMAVIPTIPLSTTGTTARRSVLVRATEPQQEEPKTSSNDIYLISQEDVDYLWKLGAGSIAGSAVIKYGSVLFPEITKPNILQALIMISTPVIVAVLLLIKQTRLEE